MADTEELGGVEERLRALGRDLERDWPGLEVSSAVLARLDPPPPRRAGTWLRGRRAAVAVAIAAVLGVGAVSPVGAAVARWLGFGGVAVEQPRDDSSPLPSSQPSAPPPTSPGLTFEDAAALVGFTPATAESLGPPAGIEVSADRRVLSMSWDASTGSMRLDQFDGELSWVWLKRVMPEDVRFTRVGTHEAVWFGTPHPLTYVDAEGREHVADARMSAPALVWVVDGVTRRLEGEHSLGRATTLAEAID